MPFDLVWETRGVFRKYFGDFTAEEFLRSFRIVHGDERFDGLRYVINDFLAVEKIAVSETSVRLPTRANIASTMPNLLTRGRAVAVEPTSGEESRPAVGVGLCQRQQWPIVGRIG